MALAANSTGIIILGGGVAKHHICNANIWVSTHEQLSIIATVPAFLKSNNHDVTCRPLTFFDVALMQYFHFLLLIDTLK